MKKIISMLAVALLMTACDAGDESKKFEYIQEGSLANQKLIHDAKAGVILQVQLLCCTELKDFKPYVTKMPTGEAGSRVWEEQWNVNGCDKQYPVKIRFSQDGMDAAYWEILK